MKLKKGDLISWRELILQSDWIILFPLLYFSFKDLKDPNCSMRHKTEFLWVSQIPLHRAGNSDVFWRSWKFCIFCSIINYIYNQITCDTTRKVHREVGEIGSWRCFLYFVYWGINSNVWREKLSDASRKDQEDNHKYT